MIEPRFRRQVLLLLMVLVVASSLLAYSNLDRKPETTDSPEACIERLLRAEKQGDVATYRRCFSIEGQNRLQKDWSDRNASDIENLLRAKSDNLVGCATSGLKLISQSQAEVVIERIRSRDVERQTAVLVRENGSWKIEHLGASSIVTPKIPYGTPVDSK